MNEFIFTGRLTKDIEIREVGENKVANFTVACDRRKDKDGNRKTDFFECVAWNGLAETLEKYCHKGDKILVRGEINFNEYDSTKFKDENGNPARIRNMRVNTNIVEFLSTKSSTTSNSSNEDTSSHAEENDDDFPF